MQAVGSTELPTAVEEEVDIPRADIETMFASQYGVDTEELWVVSTDAAQAATLVGPDIVGSATSIRLVYALGDFTDSKAHPPQGYDLPTGKTAYLLIGDGGAILGGGLFIEDRSEEILRLGTPVRWNESA